HIGRRHRDRWPTAPNHRPRPVEGACLRMSGPGNPEQRDDTEAVDLVAVLMIAFAVALFFYLVHVILLPFVFSAVLALVLSPVVNWRGRAAHAPRLAASIAVFLVLSGLLAFAAYLLLPSLLAQGLRVSEHLQEIIERPLRSLIGDAPVQILGQSTTASDIAAA